MKKILMSLLIWNSYACGYTDKYYSDGGGGSNEGLGILFIIVIVIGFLLWLYNFIDRFFKDREFRNSVLNKSKQEVDKFTKDLQNLPKDMVSEVKTQSNLDQILFWAGVIVVLLVIISLTFGLV